MVLLLDRAITPWKVANAIHQNPSSSVIPRTSRFGIYPSRQAIRDIAYITCSCARSCGKIAILGDVSAVVASSGLVRIAVDVEILDQAVAVSCALRSVLYHREDGCIGVCGGVGVSVVGLHQSGVGDTAGGGGLANVDAAMGLCVALVEIAREISRVSGRQINVPLVELSQK